MSALTPEQQLALDSSLQPGGLGARFGAPSFLPEKHSSFGDALHNFVAKNQQATGFDIHQPIQAMNLRAISNPSAQQVAQPFPEQSPVTDPLVGQPIAGEGIAQAGTQIQEEQQRALQRLQQEESELSSFHPTEHHATTGSKVAAGVALLLGSLLGRSSSLGGGLLEGLTNTVKDIEANHQQQFANEEETSRLQTAQKQAQIAATKDSLAGLDSMAKAQEQLHRDEQKRAEDDQKWREFQEKQKEFVRHHAASEGYSKERADAYALSIRNSKETANAHNALGLLSLQQRAVASADLNSYRMASLDLRRRLADEKVTSGTKGPLKTVQKNLDDTIRTLNAGVLNTNRRADLSDDQKKAAIASQFAGAHAHIQDQINHLSRLGVDVTGYVDEASAAAEEMLPKEIGEEQSAASFSPFTAPKNAPQRPLESPPAPSKASPGLRGRLGAKPSPTGPAKAPLPHMAKPDALPKEWVNQWMAQSPETRLKWLQIHASDPAAPYLKSLIGGR
jgi:hypothetical protein